MDNKDSRPLIIDAQLFQTTAWDRGMGHYCRCLLLAYNKLKDSDVTLIFNKNLTLDNDRLQLVKELLPNASTVALDLPTAGVEISVAKKLASQVLDKFISSTYDNQEVNFLILQLFTFDYCAAFPKNAHKLLICYDIIPLLYWADFNKYFSPQTYFSHFVEFLKADIILTISEATKSKLESSFSLNPEKILNLNGAFIQHEANQKPTIVLPKERYILMPTADFPHKNNIRAVKGFAAFNRELGYSFKLIITSTISDDTQRLLSCYSDDIIFTGNISDQDMTYLYENMTALLFISKAEGLGLPILEAVHYNKPVICSSIDVFQEISKKAFYFCDPQNSQSVTVSIKNAVIQLDWDDKQAEYNHITESYTWPNSALKLKTALERDNQELSLKRGSPKLGIVFPHPSAIDGELGMFVQSLMAAILERAAAICYVSSDNIDESKKPFFLPYIVETEHASSTIQKSLNHLTPVYFIDGTNNSAEVFRRAALNPGLCYVTAKQTRNILEPLASKNYITKSLLNSFENSEVHNDLVELLKQCGNKVFNLDINKKTITSSKTTISDSKENVINYNRDVVASITRELKII